MASPSTTPPPKNPIRNLLIIVIVVIVVAVVAFLIRDYVRQFVAPFILYLLWITQLIFTSLPQAVLWAVFLVVVFFVAGRSLGQNRQRFTRKERPANVYYGRVEELEQESELLLELLAPEVLWRQQREESRKTDNRFLNILKEF